MSALQRYKDELDGAWAKGYARGKEGHTRTSIYCLLGRHWCASFDAGYAEGLREFNAFVNRVADNHTHEASC